MSQFQEVLSIYKIESWCETAIAVPIWENEDLSFRFVSDPLITFMS